MRLGLGPSRGFAHVGSYKLGQLLGSSWVNVQIIHVPPFAPYVNEIRKKKKKKNWQAPRTCGSRMGETHLEGNHPAGPSMPSYFFPPKSPKPWAVLAAVTPRETRHGRKQPTNLAKGSEE